MTTSAERQESSRTFRYTFQAALVLVCALLTTTLYRFFIHGPFIPLSCSILGRQCGLLSKIPFEGYVHEDFAEAATAFRQNFYQGEDVGASVAAYVDNQLVLDMHGGWQDIEKKIPYTSNTLQIVYSSTKMLTAIVVAQLVEKGYLSYDEKITRYWPEFGQGNKMNVTLGDLMQHAGGVGFLDSPISLAATQDPVRFSEILASQPHNFDGNRTRSYHAATRGWYLNEIIRRVTPENYTVNTWAEKYINQVYKDIEWQLKPYAECYDDRVAPIYRGPRLHRFYRKLLRVLKHGRQELSVMAALNDPDSPAHKTMRSVITGMGRTDVTSLAYRRLESPSFSGFTNAKSIAKLAAMMANQGKAIDPDEPDLLNTTTYAHVTEPVPLDYDILIRKSTPALKGGFGVMDDLTMDNVTFVGWTGMGGSIFFWNPEYKIAFGYCTNSMASFNPADERSMSILRAIVKQVLKSH